MSLFVTEQEKLALRRMLPLLELNKLQFVVAVLLGALGLGASIGLAATSAWLIARASQHPPVLYLSVAAVGVRFFGISKALLRYAQRLASHHVAMDGIAALRENVYRRLAASRTDTVTGLKRGDILARTGADVDALGDLLIKSILPACVAAVTAIGTVIGIAFLSPAAAAAIGIGLCISGIAGPILTVKSARVAELADEKARVDLASNALTLLDHHAELAVSGRSQYLRKEISHTEDELVRSKDASARPAAFAAALDGIAMTIAVVGAIIFGVPETNAGLVAAVALAVLVLTPLAAFEGTAELAPAAVQLVRSARAAVRIDELLDEPHTAKKTDVPRIEDGPVLRAENLAVGWPGGPIVASGINLELRPGSRLAIVGPSGIGKSTILYTLAGMLKPRQGQVTLNGVDIAQIDSETVGAYLSLTAEDAHIFATSVLENLRVANPEVTPAQAHTYLRKAGMENWLDSLHEGLDTVLGSGGTTVSGGERRRLLLARALASPANLMLLDEPGEHIDTVTADRLVSDLLNIPATSATPVGLVVVTHRLAPLAAADEILVLSPNNVELTEGYRCASVSDRGTHHDLLQRNSTYRWTLEREGAL
ncbi:MAG: thiol reductant ABC exporter subunit CydC [Actinomycetaceae bacterium]|nr:thiol reductant ABC exporter subunit CydC [Actinomycetaceae bacterium]